MGSVHYKYICPLDLYCSCEKVCPAGGTSRKVRRSAKSLGTMAIMNNKQMRYNVLVSFRDVVGCILEVWTEQGELFPPDSSIMLSYTNCILSFCNRQ